MNIKTFLNKVNGLLKLRNRNTNRVDHRDTERISADEWNRILISPELGLKLINRVRDGVLSPWGREILNTTLHGESVVEVGSGTGEISLYLAMEGRKITLVDRNLHSLEFSKQCASELGLHVITVEVDALHNLPFQDGSFDWAWSSGLLEHFTPQERRHILSEKSRISRKGVITLVPNAASIGYRAGKSYQEERGIWEYGLEIPILSLREDYQAVNLRVDTEYSVGFQIALEFLPPQDYLRKALSKWMLGKSDEYLRDCHQGYLLFTKGHKSKEE